MAEEDVKNDKVKRRKIRKSDWEKVQDFLKKELQRRKDSPFRRNHETKWGEIDRQISMEAMKKFLPSGKEAPATWESAFELGELSKASEVITADVIRLIFPQNRTWFEAHVKPPMTVNPQGKSVVAVDPKRQKLADGSLRAMMAQQHLDFGLKARVKLSVKEALHHGGFVATCDWESQNKVYDGQGLETLEAPVWVPHSMWNCFPDPSPSVVPGAIFYQGSMMITSYMPRYKVLQLKGDGYMNIDPKKIPKRKNNNKDNETEDVEILTYYGDLVIERDDGDIYLPNSKCKTANGVVIYYATNPLPFPEIIYAGYERQDVRDPYFTSPIIKNSPIQKLATILANKFIDGVSLWAQPPGTYDGNDAYLVQMGGPALFPGAMSPTKGSNKVTFMQVGDPNATLMGLQMALQKLEEGTAVNALRSGGQDSDRKTATEVHKTAQGAEVRTVDFVGDLEPCALRPWLYMQHELNLKRLKSYSFYCPEKGLPSFLTITKKELPKVVHFDIVGSKGILGEERRAQQMTAVTAWASQTPGFAELLNRPLILSDMYEDAGVKGAEEYVSEKQNIPPQAQAQMQQMQELIKELQQKLQEAQSKMQAEMAKIELQRDKTREEIQMAKEKAEQDYRLEVQKMANEWRLAVLELKGQMALQSQESKAGITIDMNKAAAEGSAVMQNVALDHAGAVSKATEKLVGAADKLVQAADKMTERAVKKNKAKITRTSSGYEVSED